eukprot:TRINITY_DN212_c1_g1_i20.p2 TRINITY_DN212_c1_g1~~TRINITY_DN212_c1_g1_i20.p2  ORF type:complete len:259 (-),score=-40.35 TRINITY_DN212_c1_g1_i20:1063-1839(-)
MLPSNVINIGLLNTTKKNRFNFITSIQHITITYQTRRNANIKMSHRHQSTQKIRKKDLNVQLSSQCHIKRVTSQVGLLTTKKIRSNVITSIQHITITYQTRRNANIKMSHRHQSTQKIRKKDLNVQLSSQCHIKRVTSQVGLLTTKKIRSNVITSVQHTTLPYLARHNSNIKTSHHMQHIDIGILRKVRMKDIDILSSSNVTSHVSHHTLIYLKQPRKIGLILQHQSKIQLYHTQHDLVLTSKCHITCVTSILVYLKK